MNGGKTTTKPNPQITEVTRYYAGVQAVVLGAIPGILAAPGEQPQMLVEQSLDLLAVLLRPSTPHGVQSPHGPRSCSSPQCTSLLPRA